MHELLAQVFGYLRGIWRYRWIAVVVAWLVAIAGWVYVWQLPDQYRASARLFVDTNTILRPLLRGLTVQPDPVQRVAMVSRMLLTRPNLEKILNMSDLDLKVRTEREKQEILSDLSERIRLNGDRSNPSLYTVAFAHRDPESAKKVVRSLVSVFIEEALVSDQMASSSAQDFLDQEIADYESRLKESEQQLADFKREYAGLLPGEHGNYYDSLESAKAALKDAQLALREAVRRRDELKEQLNRDKQAGPEESARTEMVPQQVEDPRVARLQSQLDQLLLRYTDRHPEVVVLQRTIEEVKERNRRSGAGVGDAAAAMNVQSNTIYGSLTLAVSEADAQVAALKGRVEDHAERVERIEDKIDNIPRIEAQMKELTRNYNTVSAQHEKLLERRESARLSTQVETAAEGVKFRVIDPPFVPSRPSSPNRAALSALVLLFAIGGGLAAALAFDLLRPVYDDRRALYHNTGFPVFGTVGLVESHAARRRGRLMLVPFVASWAGLIVAFIVVGFGLPIA